MPRRNWVSRTMHELIVTNTGPLIALWQADALDVAGRLPLEFVCPAEVRAELDAGTIAGHPAIDPPWLRVVPLTHEVPVAAATLGRGEAAVVQLAVERRIETVCIDDWKGRRMAMAVGLAVTGTLGLLARAKVLGLIPQLRPLVDRLNRTGNWYDEELVRRVLKGVGE